MAGDAQNTALRDFVADTFDRIDTGQHSRDHQPFLADVIELEQPNVGFTALARMPEQICK
jgi:hypothetical protein